MENATPEITGFHAHIYYDAQLRHAAASLRKELADRFEVVMGRWRDKPVGPHPEWSYQVAFAPALFGEIVPWLALNRRGLTILVHPDTGDDLTDHSDNAMWLGASLDLDLDQFAATDDAAAE
jgi:aromatic ring-cleaving dioxygenase